MNFLLRGGSSSGFTTDQAARISSHNFLCSNPTNINFNHIDRINSCRYLDLCWYAGDGRFYRITGSLHPSVP